MTQLLRHLILIVALLLQACGGGGGDAMPAAAAGPSQSPQSCSIADQRQHVLDFMNGQYYWYTQLRTPDANAATMDAYFQSMLYQPTDRFSYTETTASFQQLFDEGTFTGYGYSLAIGGDASNPTLRVRTVEPKGPAAAAGLRRGDTIISVNGFTAAQVAAGSAGAVSSAGVQRTMQVRDVAGNFKSIDMVSATFALTPVRDVVVLNATRAGQPVKVGYLDYTQFVTYSLTDLQNTIASFVQQGATELVLDLRYNGGGDVDTSRDLASLIVGVRAAGRTFAALRYNDKNSAKNTVYTFNAQATATPNATRVFIIASGGTASASELVINGLKPVMDVVLIGSTTYGKPYGFEPFSYCGTTYNAVNFEVFNAAGVGGYTAGIAPTCPASDDLDHALGDPQEGELKIALNYIATGSCAQTPQSAALDASSVTRPPRTLGDLPKPGMHRR